MSGSEYFCVDIVMELCVYRRMGEFICTGSI